MIILCKKKLITKYIQPRLQIMYYEKNEIIALFVIFWNICNLEGLVCLLIFFHRQNTHFFRD